MPGDRGPTKQQFRLRGLGDAWLPMPRAYMFELNALASQLDDDETPIGVYAMRWNGAIFDGLLAVTDRNLRFARFRWLRRRLTYQVALSEIQDARVSPTDPRVVEIDLVDGTSLALESIDPNRSLTSLVEAIISPPVS